MANKHKQRMAQKRAARQRKNRNILIVIGLAVVGVGAYLFSSNSPATLPSDISDLGVGIEVGIFAPDFTPKDLNGAPVSLSDFRGKPVAIMFFHSW